MSVVLSAGGCEKKGKEVWGVWVAEGDGEAVREKGESGKEGKGQYEDGMVVFLKDVDEAGGVLLSGNGLSGR